MHSISDIHGLYHLDPAHSALGFHVRHAGLSRVRGTFDQFQGYAIVDRDNVEHSALMVTISTSSINTFVADRDAHLRSPDFLDVAAFPAITFVATAFEILDESRVRVAGDLTIKDATRPVGLVLHWTGSATDPFGNERVGFESELVISRKDFGITWNAALETGGWLVGDQVTLDIEASAVKQAGAAGDEAQQIETVAMPDHTAEPGLEVVMPDSPGRPVVAGGGVPLQAPAGQQDQDPACHQGQDPAQDDGPAAAPDGHGSSAQTSVRPQARRLPGFLGRLGQRD